MFTRHRSYRSLLQNASKGARHKLWLCVKVCLFFGIFLLVYCLQYSTWNFGFATHEVIINLTENYFRPNKNFYLSRLLVNTSKCRIPDIDIWSPDISSAIRKTSSLNCMHHQINLTYVKGQSVVINQYELQSMGYDLKDISCCYKTIKRVQQSKYKYNKNADNDFRYSENCYPMQNVTEPVSGFIRVTCTGNSSVYWNQVNYKNFHLIARIPNDMDDVETVVTDKISYWKKCVSAENSGSYCKNVRLKGRPPNVLLIGIDSTSRLNFHRFLPQTVDTLQNTLRAVEMKGYTKVGENTFPNFVPLMSSFSENELRNICYPSRWKPQDKCPYIWKNFSSLNYLTAHLEDSPQMAIFNYMKTGFIYSPVDIYLRPWMRAVYKDSWTLDCIGYKRPEKAILDYVVDLASLAEKKGLPYFFTTWMTDLTHDDTTKVQSMDSMLSTTLENLKDRELLKNTVLFVMSDHGYRFADIRVTSSGWYEDKLPALFIRLPESLSKMYPEYHKQLSRNSNQLTTPFNVHATLEEILSIASIGGSYQPFSHNTEKEDTSNFQTNLRSISLFQKIPPRNCDEAGVPKQFCACNPPVGYNSTNATSQILLGAEKLVRHINHALPKVCEPLILETITAAATLTESGKTYSLKSQRKRKPTQIDYIIGFITQPGNFRFEGYLSFNKRTNRFTRISHILRTNKVSRSTSCLDNLMGEAVGMEVFCYCKGFQYSW